MNPFIYWPIEIKSFIQVKENYLELKAAAAHFAAAFDQDDNASISNLSVSAAGSSVVDDDEVREGEGAEEGEGKEDDDGGQDKDVRGLKNILIPKSAIDMCLGVLPVVFLLYNSSWCIMQYLCTVFFLQNCNIHCLSTVCFCLV